MIGWYVAIVFGLAWVPLYFVRTEDAAEALEHYSPAERRWVRLTPILIGLHVSLTCMLLMVGAPPPLWRVLIGLVLFTSAAAFWIWARIQIGPPTRRRLPDQPPVVLRCDGPFGLVRNPLYLGYAVAAASLALVAAEPILVVTFSACIVALVIRSEQEERRLHAQLGDRYAAYCRTVRRLIPYLW